VNPSYLEIEAHGSPRQIGHAVGEAARHLIAAGIAFYEEYHHEMGSLTFAEAELESLAYLAPARRWVPGVVEELEGMAEGSGVPLSKLLVPNLGEELTCNDDPAGDSSCLSHGRARARRRGGHCTTVAIMAGGRHIVAHNEDWFAGDADNNVVVRLTTLDGTRILGVTSAALLAPTGINSHAIAGGANTVYSDDNRVGVPNNLLRRWALEATSLEEARDRCLLTDRARGSNHLFGDAGGRIWNLETSGAASALVEADAWYAHTNHYLSPEMAVHELSTSANSRTRVARAQHLVQQGLERGDDAAVIAAGVLADHANGANCICGHPDDDDSYGEREMTTASMIWDLDAMSVDVAFGPPCENERVRFSLD
jgi:isopenicillin-N N-acyltransferase like protein